ncbi:MAG: hypothetical protein HOQ43_10840 [Glycomyces artemisiae]|uniref:Uncharacterized protein n=1 Tax=Glycomyces artemisiae TaxID=1076443 RepID=A0A850CAV6_9ACTN|nr:hypothetical protein [Glycomyces artemisiae]
MEPDRIIALAVIVVCVAIMWWQSSTASRAADRAETARSEAEAAERRTLATQESTRNLHAKVAGLAAAIGHDADIITNRTTGRTVYSYGPDGEIKEGDRE